MLDFIADALIALLAGAFCAFLFFFVVRYHLRRRKIDALIDHLAELRRQADLNGNPVLNLSAVDQHLVNDETLLHLWREFRDTLHAERSTEEFDDHGQPRVLRYRQTAPAESFFDTRALVDQPLNTDFFRHLPGMLTGLGIIATFTGLIKGLSGFDVSGDPEEVNRSVTNLVVVVGDAFKFSGLAIFASIGVTVWEKAIITRLSGRVERLQQTIDAMFDAGAGEDYLSAIARKSEESSTHLAHLKDGLVNDLRAILEEMTDRQTKAQFMAAQVIGDSVNQTFQEPIERMTSAMERSLEDQREVVHQLMEGSLDAFAERLETMIGAKLTDAASHVESAAGTMREALNEVPGQISAAAAEVQAAFAQLPAQVSAAVEELRTALAEAPQHIEAAVSRLRSALDELVTSTEPISANAERIATASASLATTIEQSTETLDYALDRFRGLGTEMAASIDSARTIGTSLAEGAEGAQAAAEALVEMGGELERASAGLRGVVVELAEVVERAEHDGKTHEDLARAVTQAASQLETAQDRVDAFLEGLGDVLSEAHATFGLEVNRTLDRTHDAFHQNLANATERLAGTVNEFGDFLETDFKDSVDALHTEMARLAPMTAAEDGADSNGQGTAS